MSKNILIIGATSAIAESTAKLLATRQYNFYLTARNLERLQTLCQDLLIRGANQVDIQQFDVNDFDHHQTLILTVLEKLGHIDVVLIAHGTLSNQKLCEEDVTHTLQELNTNALSTISLLTYLANEFEKQGHGTLAVISSVAGDRGRQSNYVYGTAKGALTIFLQGLRNRLQKSNIQVLTIKPGFVDTPMTAQIEKKGLLWATSDQVASGIVKAIDKKSSVVYLPKFWRTIMFVVRSIPERIFCHLKL